MDVNSSVTGRTNETRDLDTAKSTDWPSQPFPLLGPRKAGTCVVIRQSVLNEIHRHGQSRKDVEVCGVLVGNGYQDSEGAFVHVEASIRGEHAGNELAQVTFTSETWCHIQDIMDREHSARRIVGWYHTHPGFGIFLSPMDLFIHENFFAGPEQLALVYDPIGGDEGIFVWRAGKPVRESVLIEGDETNEAGVESPVTRRFPVLTAAASADPNLDLRIERIEQRQRSLLLGLVIVTLISIAWPVVLFWLSSQLAEDDRPAAKPWTRRNQAGPTKTDPTKVPPDAESENPGTDDLPAEEQKKSSTDLDTQR